METTHNNNQVCSRIMEHATARWISEPMYVAARLGIADFLAQGPQTVEDLAEKTGTVGPYLFRILRALASVGIFKQTGKNKFENTPLSECLKSEVMQGIVLFFLSPWHNDAWGRLYESVKTGKNAFESVHGIPAFEWFKTHPGAGEVFHRANSQRMEQIARQVLRVYDFSLKKQVIDIGGGTGTFMTEFLRTHPHATGVIADLPFVIPGAEKLIKKNQLEKRCSAVECDFFKAIPGGGDVYILANILHDWDDEKAGELLTHCREAMKKDAVLLIVEMLVPGGNSPSIAKLMDLEVLVMGNGKERTLEEFRDLCAKGGFTIRQVFRIGENESLLECVVVG